VIQPTTKPSVTISKTTSTAFPFPPVLSNPKSPSIINITSAGSEASDASSFSLQSVASSDDSSEKYENLDTAIIQVSHHESDVSIQSQGAVSLIESDAPSTTLSRNSSRQSLMLSTTATSTIFIPVKEKPHIQEDRDSDIQLTLSTQHECYEDDAGKELRTRIVEELDKLVKQWVRSEGLRQSMHWNQVEKVGGKVVCYGSFKLEVVDKESDLDLLCIVPKHVTREAFFKTLYQQLEKKDEVTELRKLPSAFVPVIKMKYRGMEVDLTMSRLMASEKVPEEEEILRDPHITTGMDQRCLRSLNGFRATCEIVELVPNKEEFRLTLRVIKLWAKKNGLYGNMLGYLGGASWAILVAKVCQLYGNEGYVGSINLVPRFFYTFANWNWPEPVYIKKVDSQPSYAWNPALHSGDTKHVMPIITSTAPQMNSAVNVYRSNCLLISAKCAEAFALCQSILQGVCSWSDLFQPSKFFEEFKSYILISGSCHGDSGLWFGSIESKLRQLSLHIANCDKVSAVRVWPQPFQREGQGLEQMWFFGLRMVMDHRPETIQEPLHVFTDLCMETATKSVSRYSSTFSVRWQHLQQSQLGRFLSKQQLGMEVSEKLSYAAVTTQGITMASPRVIPSLQTMPAYPKTVPLASPVPMVPSPYAGVFPNYHMAGMGVPWQNFIVYSTGVSNNAAEQAFFVHPGQTQLDLPRPEQVYPPPPFQQHRAHQSPQPGGYPHFSQTQGPTSRPSVRYKSPLTPAPHLGSNSRASPQYPPPTAQPLTSYPPPPFSPISQFRSPPPPVPRQLQPPPQTKLPSSGSCSGKAAEEKQVLEIRNQRRQKESVVEDDRLRSVSYSSDKFPPPSLNLARVSHQDQLPLSPSYSMTGVVPLPNVDMSVPPPSLSALSPTLSPSALSSPSSSSLSVSFNQAKKRAWRIPRSPRISVSEISDMKSPQPVRANNATNNNIKFSLTRNRHDSVFHGC